MTTGGDLRPAVDLYRLDDGLEANLDDIAAQLGIAKSEALSVAIRLLGAYCTLTEQGGALCAILNGESRVVRIND